MQIQLNQMTLKSKKVLTYLVNYLEKVKDYENFNPFGMLNVFVNKDMDFTAFEAVDYNLQFTSSAHKLTETITSPYTVPPVSFDQFFVKIQQLAREAQV